MPFGAVFAQEKTDTSTTTTVVDAPEKPLSITERKTKAYTDLSLLETQFRLFATRTQLTIDRLNTKDVNTIAAQKELTLSITSLDIAKKELDTFTAIKVSDDMSDEALEKAGIKTSLIKIQDNLKEARIHLIQSLVELKSSVHITITQ